MSIDKQLHFLAGAAIAASVTLYSTHLWGLLACLAGALAKEAYDATGRGTVDVWDFLATVLGGGVLLPLIFLPL